MSVEHHSFAGLDFWLAGTLEIQRDAGGGLAEYSHSFGQDVKLNRHAAGPFCRMGLPRAPRAAGVYVITITDEIRYVGRCDDMAQRFGPTGYGEIHPRNCHHDGQSTNCKLNARVLEAAKQGFATHVWFHHTPEHHVLEQLLISQLSPPWNGTVPGVNRARRQPQDRTSGAAAKPEGPPATADQFRRAIADLLATAERDGTPMLEVRAGDLHRIVGGYPGQNHRMPMCCAAMRAAMHPGDRFVYQPPKGNGASLTIGYHLPRGERTTDAPPPRRV